MNPTYTQTVLPPEIREAKTGFLLRCCICEEAPATETGRCKGCQDRLNECDRIVLDSRKDGDK